MAQFSEGPHHISLHYNKMQTWNYSENPRIRSYTGLITCMLKWSSIRLMAFSMVQVMCHVEVLFPLQKDILWSSPFWFFLVGRQYHPCCLGFYCSLANGASEAALVILKQSFGIDFPESEVVDHDYHGCHWASLFDHFSVKGIHD